MNTPDIDDIKFLWSLWSMYNDAPLFWLFAIPFILWWVNFFRRQFRDLQLPAVRRLLSPLVRVLRISLPTVGRLLDRLVESGGDRVKPWRPWAEFSFFAGYVTVGLVMVGWAAAGRHAAFSREWWLAVSPVALLAFICVAVFAPLFWLKVRRRIARLKATATVLSNTFLTIGARTWTFGEVFVNVGAELQFGVRDRFVAETIRQYLSAQSVKEENWAGIVSQLVDLWLKERLVFYRSARRVELGTVRFLRLTTLGADVRARMLGEFTVRPVWLPDLSSAMHRVRTTVS